MAKKILFFGELPPNIVHGISVSNQLNIDLLAEYFNVDIIEEKSDLQEHMKRNGAKLKNVFLYATKLMTLNKLNLYDYFYTVFSLSTFGCLKTLLNILSFRLSGKGKVILHIHRGDFKVFYQAHFINRLVTKLIFHCTYKLIVLSQNQSNEFQEFFHRGKIFVLENSLNQEYSLKEKKIGKKSFLYISNYIKEKGVFELFDVFQNQHERQLECFGSFVNNNEKKIRSYQSDFITINGFINGEEKYKKIYEADCLILPSWNEGQPMVILEAMMLGTIIITTNVGLIVEMLGEDYPFYCEPHNREDLEKCIQKFIDYTDKETLSENIRKRYQNNFSKAIHKQKLLKIFGEDVQ
ncbi:MAG: glycosyl transferase [Proteobacteria bacterium]|nr:glycosyl transferase [Pseudomonadota bacterium]